ncbi:c-type cytochrome [Curvibacter sp. APW13]|uniref:c-type cytochrome n=1 Tax=Curvibacter sp. APW13 TaxID=3077236 RepID=UPI0028DE25A4|nr:c-type cytochrome [Curvibacter sp. APW13]MDT8990680.1 c-type cytochrome [Curvibacter sp. APW13]
MSHSAHSNDTHASTRPPLKLLTSVGASFVLPLVVVGVLVSIFLSGGSSVPKASMAEDAVAARIQKVGSIAFAEARKEARTGEQVFQAQCGACHATGAAGSPKFGDAAAWGPRIGKGFDALLTSALKGKGNMSPQGGGASSDFEVARAVVYMANAGGAKFAEPKAPK